MKVCVKKREERKREGKFFFKCIISGKLVPFLLEFFESKASESPSDYCWNKLFILKIRRYPQDLSIRWMMGTESHTSVHCNLL